MTYNFLICFKNEFNLNIYVGQSEYNLVDKIPITIPNVDWFHLSFLPFLKNIYLILKFNFIKLKSLKLKGFNELIIGLTQ